MRCHVQELRGHLDGELVGLQLLRDHRAPDGAAALLPLLEAPARVSGIGGISPRQVAHLPLLLLRELVEAEDAAALVVIGGVRLGGALGLDQRRVRRDGVDRLVERLFDHRAKLIAARIGIPDEHLMSRG